MPEPNGPKRESLALAYASGLSSRRAAKLAGVARSTARRWAADPSFRVMVTSLREQIISRACGVYARGSVKGALAAVKLLESTDEEIRVKAIGIINAALLALSTREALFTEAAAAEAPSDAD